MIRKPTRPTKRAMRKDTTELDLYNFMTGGDDLKEVRDVIRTIIYDDPIDLIRLEIGLRHALAATRKISVEYDKHQENPRTDDQS